MIDSSVRRRCGSVRAQTGAIVISAVSLAGCSFAPIVSRQSVDYNRTVEDVTNTILVTNILRGRDSAPLSFSDISQIRGSFTASFADQTVFPYGPRFGSMTRDSGTAGPLTVTSSPGFDIAPLNTKQFYLGILSPISESIVAYYLQRNIPPRLVLDLFISQIDSRTEKGDAHFSSGSESDTIRRNFYDILDRWTASNAHHPLKVMVTDRSSPFGPPVKIDATTIIAAKAAGLKIETAKGSGKSQFQQSSTKLTLCVPSYDDTAYVAVGFVLNDSSKLNPSEKFGDSRECSPDGTRTDETIKYQAHLRSVEGLFYYLGFLQTDQKFDSKFPVYIYDHPIDDERFAVEYQGARYHIGNLKKDPPDVTVAILAILNDVVNINRDANEIPSTKTVAVAR